MTKANQTDSAADTEALQKQIQALVDDMSKLTEIVKDLGAQRVEALRASGKDAMRDARDAGAARMQQAEATVRENPGMAMGLAAGLGFLAGAILARK